ncbi:MAG: glycosyltransferase family 2 protein [Eggerthellaceae bacterium]|jgi:GT2 family glycosyltransferase|nr:glycosyltransferase family 2 protein [Eggerthellaceae bacterium]
MRRIAAVVVTYNRVNLLLQCIEALKSQRFDSSSTSLDILIIDNASTDGTEQTLKPLANDGEIMYYNTGSNLGGAGGFNYGMKQAVSAGYDDLWVMDDDCLPHDDALQALLNADAHLKGHYGYLSSVVRWTDGSICRMNVQRHPLNTDITDFTLQLQPCTLASFVSLFVPASIVAEVGLPIKDFFIWTDDWDFTRRISRRYDCFVVGDSVVTHASKNNGAGTIATDVPERLDRYRKIYRNDVVLYRQEGFNGYAYIIMRDLYHIIQVILHSSGQRCKKIGIIVSGTIAGFRFHPQIEYVTCPTHTIVSVDCTNDVDNTKNRQHES